MPGARDVFALRYTLLIVGAVQLLAIPVARSIVRGCINLAPGHRLPRSTRPKPREPPVAAPGTMAWTGDGSRADSVAALIMLTRWPVGCGSRPVAGSSQRRFMPLGSRPEADQPRLAFDRPFRFDAPFCQPALNPPEE
jgi:hypothetical protein